MVRKRAGISASPPIAPVLPHRALFVPCALCVLVCFTSEKNVPLCVTMETLSFCPNGRAKWQKIVNRRDFDRVLTDETLRHAGAKHEARRLFLFNSNNCQRRKRSRISAVKCTKSDNVFKRLYDRIVSKRPHKVGIVAVAHKMRIRCCSLLIRWSRMVLDGKTNSSKIAPESRPIPPWRKHNCFVVQGLTASVIPRCFIPDWVHGDKKWWHKPEWNAAQWPDI